MKLMSRLFLGLMLVIVLCGGFVALHTSSTPAHAASCYGDYCTGKNPYSTGCASSAYRWGYTAVIGYDFDNHSYSQIGNLELWISKECATRWARVVLWSNPSDESYKFGITQSNGYTIISYTQIYAGTYYTYQIYNRSLCSYAWINDSGGHRTGCALW